MKVTTFFSFLQSLGGKFGCKWVMKFLTKDIYGFLPFKKVEIIEKIDARAQTTLI